MTAKSNKSAVSGAVKNDPVYYKAVNLDHCSHYDKETLWKPSIVVTVEDADPDPDADGRGLHCSPSLLEAVGYQSGASEYLEVRPLDIIAVSTDKVRGKSILPIRYLSAEETDVLAGFKLWEANHPINPLLIEPGDLESAKRELILWDSVRDSVRDSVWESVVDSVGDSVGNSIRDRVGASVGDSVWESVVASVMASVGDSVGDRVGDSIWDSVGASVRDSVRESVGDSVWASVWDSVWAYTGGLFPGITSWKYAGKLGADPWRPLLNLWYTGYVPSFDGKAWRLHTGKDAKVLWQGTIEELRREQK